MNVVVLRGTISSEPHERTLPSGVNVLNWDVNCAEVPGSVPVQWDDPPNAALAFGDGDEVVVSGVVRRRFFRAGGITASRTEVLADRAAKPTQKVAVRRLLDSATEHLAD
ncbi:MAG: single-stranded DNA-binding protein [Acidimicrobiales bacterium]|nr:single-stranded DNA-binding protein [Acidimicrobiales bacterium]RZV46270.1 MAG: single-stranded DNA-binding protein [Acidimicrobiales bacterium]